MPNWGFLEEPICKLLPLEFRHDLKSYLLFIQVVEACKNIN